MIRKLTIILAFLTLSAPAMAQSMCNKRGSFVKHLSSKYAEAPVAMGLSAEGSVLEVLASQDGTWTIIVTRPSGVSCVVAYGESWEAVPILASRPGV